MKLTKTTATFCAVLAAALYALNAPFSKLLLQNVEPTMMAAFLYLGAGLGMLALQLFLLHGIGVRAACLLLLGPGK